MRRSPVGIVVSSLAYVVRTLLGMLFGAIWKIVAMLVAVCIRVPAIGVVVAIALAVTLVHYRVRF